MVLKANQTTQFFEEGGQMGITPRTRTKLTEEWITCASDLADFD